MELLVAYILLTYRCRVIRTRLRHGNTISGITPLVCLEILLLASFVFLSASIFAIFLPLYSPVSPPSSVIATSEESVEPR